MARMDYRKARKLNNEPVAIRKERSLSKFKTDPNYTMTYRDKNFWIGERQISRYRPDRERIEHGIVFNATASRFEAWKSGKMLSQISWKVGQAALKEWAAKFGG